VRAFLRGGSGPRLESLAGRAASPDRPRWLSQPAEGGLEGPPRVRGPCKATGSIGGLSRQPLAALGVLLGLTRTLAVAWPEGLLAGAQEP
jgi:hypothetical protein